MAILITGVAGFIGSNLAKERLMQGEVVFGIDNFCRGSEKNILAFKSNINFTFEKVEMTNLKEYEAAISVFFQTETISELWHFAANSDIPAGIESSDIDLTNTFLTTYNSLLIMKKFKIKNLYFASTSAIYGDLGQQVLFEEIGPLFPISNYGAMKLASEAIISAAAEQYLSSAYIFRFPNVIGIPATHGVILDFIKKLKANPTELNVLGDGSQQKAYLHVEDLIDAMLFIKENVKQKLNYFNIGANDDGISVKVIAEQVVNSFDSKAKIIYGKGRKGWIGDVPQFKYSIQKLSSLGWSPKLNSKNAVLKAIDQIIKQET